uniref:HTH marR-type domain-containing protein n=1 Tax=Metallosphaera hakonensis JCM 8857 = DSM 7519 TaxID=1293036 RepID=A0A2U9IVY5_9CREN
MGIREDVLLFLFRHGESKLPKIASQLDLDQEDLLSILRPMELEGLLKREVKGLIRKEPFYSLTEKGYNEARKINDSL